jgi:pilus assembly protein Flp/PilA
MNPIKCRWQQFEHQEGQDLAEYAILLGLIALVVILAVSLLGANISTVFSNLSSQVGSWW